ncbi:molybdopterin molybdotransferase MoeA, partial [Chloroflexota bacterium]
GWNVRYRGEDIEKGTLVLSRGTVLNPPEIGVLASLGRATASVIRRPLIAIMATGNEIVGAGQPLSPGKIHNSNTYSIASQISYHGAIPKILGIARDSVEDLNDKIEAGLSSADMLITTGGVSLGDYDMVKDVLAKRGRIDFWTVRMKPGKPLAFGVLHKKGKGQTQEVPHLGLPGNPVSAMISFEQFARPAIMKMLGKRLATKPSITAIMQERITNSDNRRILSRVFITRHGAEYHAHLTGKQGSGILTSISKARGMAIIPEDTAEVKPGDTVRVELWDWDQDWVYGYSDEA